MAKDNHRILPHFRNTPPNFEKSMVYGSWPWLLMIRDSTYTTAFYNEFPQFAFSESSIQIQRDTVGLTMAEVGEKTRLSADIR